jgi:pimeloyl-ACP methyl ester carboxylesterase
MESLNVFLQNGYKIHVQVSGEPHAHPLLLLHGYPSSHLLWRKCLPELAKHYRVYAPDLIGHGRSDKPLGVDYDLNFLAEFIRDLQLALGLEHMFLGAHDLGGMGALGFAANYPESIDKFIIMNTAPYVDWPKLLYVMMQRIRNPVLAQVCLVPPVFRWILQTYLVHDPRAIDTSTAEMYRRPWVENLTARRVFRRAVLCPPPAMALAADQLKQIDMPTLILWGGADRILPSRFAKRLHKDLPDSQLEIIPDCGHFLQEERPDHVVQHMVAFLNPISSTEFKGAA